MNPYKQFSKILSVLIGITAIVAIVLVIRPLTGWPPLPTQTPEPTETLQLTETANIPTPTSTKTPEPNNTIKLTKTPPQTDFPSTADEAIEWLKQKEEKPEKLVVGIRVAPPFVVEMGGGQYGGFDIDLINRMVKRWSVPDIIEFKLLFEADDRIDCVAGQECDVSISAITDNFERCYESGVLCSEVYINEGAGFLVQEDSGIDSILDLSGKSIAYVDGTTGEENIDTLINDYRYPVAPKAVKKKDRDEAINHVKQGIVDVYITDALILKEFESNGLVVMRKTDSDELFRFTSEPYVIMVNEDNKGLNELLNWTLGAMKLDRTYDYMFDDLMGCGENRNLPFPIKTDFFDTFSQYPGFTKSDSVPEPICEGHSLCEEVRTILYGETLAGLARECYGDPELYVCIQKANDIKDIYKVPAGSDLTIPIDC